MTTLDCLEKCCDLQAAFNNVQADTNALLRFVTGPDFQPIDETKTPTGVDAVGAADANDLLNALRLSTDDFSKALERVCCCVDNLVEFDECC